MGAEKTLKVTERGTWSLDLAQEPSLLLNTSAANLLEEHAPDLISNMIALRIKNKFYDLKTQLTEPVLLEFISRGEATALELLRHDCAHVLAEAVQSLFPGTQVSIGPPIDEGFYYDFQFERPFTPEDFPIIEKKMQEIIARQAPFTCEIWSREKAKNYFSEKGETFKVSLIDLIPEGEDIKIYRQGEWLDLCRGPHMVHTGQIGEAFKLMKVAGAYWRGDARNPMLTRIYGTAFWTREELETYLLNLKEAEKRDHRRLGREMELFHFEEEAPGTIFWHHKGWTIFQILKAYMRRRQKEAGYIEVNTPQLLDRALWETSGHWETYQENMFTTPTEDGRLFALKPMSCPGHVQIFRNGLKSYRDLPLRLCEFGVVHRYEPSGALHGLMRVRAFTQDDAHIFCTEEQLLEESLKISQMILSIYADFGFKDIQLKLSTRPEKRVGTDQVWDKAEAALQKVLEEIRKNGMSTALNPGEGAFYGPKLEYVLRDALGRAWQCGTLQVDFNLPERLKASYVGAQNDKHIPIMLHQAMFGSIERFIGILIEHYGGHFPLWLAPTQIMICTISQEADSYAHQVAREANALGLRTELDLRNQKISYKIREHSFAKIPILFILGQRESAEQRLSLRRLGSPATQNLSLKAALQALQEEALAPDLLRERDVRTAAEKSHLTKILPI